MTQTNMPKDRRTDIKRLVAARAEWAGREGRLGSLGLADVNYYI